MARGEVEGELAEDVTEPFVFGNDAGWDPLIGFLDRPTRVPDSAVQAPFGSVNLPKRKSDEVKLKIFFEICRSGNLREARSFVFHEPHLLPYTDQHGFTALHHAQLSKNAEFYAGLLDLLQDPKNFLKKVVWYDSADALRRDGLRLHREADALRPQGGIITVQQVPKESLAARNDVKVGDRLEGLFSEALGKPKKLRKLLEEASAVASGKLSRGAEDSFPMGLEFRGPALREIIAEGMAGLYNANKKSMRERCRKRFIQRKQLVPERKHGETFWPKKGNSVDAHSAVVPTLLVSEQDAKSPGLFDPIGFRPRGNPRDGKASRSCRMQGAASLPVLVPPPLDTPQEIPSPARMGNQWLPTGNECSNELSCPKRLRKSVSQHTLT
jgi:hypothetical protein